MNKLRFYFRQSLIGHFYRRARARWFTPPPPPPPAQVDLHGVTLQVDCLPQGMQEPIRLGHYEFAEIKILPALITASDRVLEIGAAIGFLGLYCRKIVKVRDLVSVEPNATTLSYFRRNYELNGFTPCVIEAALAAADGPVSFYVSDMFWGDTLTPPSGTAAATLVTVPGLSFASIVQRSGIEFNAIIIDVEGAEEHLPIASLPDHVKKILIEIHPELIGTRPAYRVLENLIRAGFNVQDHCHNSWALIRN